MSESREVEVMPASAVEALNRSEIQSQIEIAKQYPRTMSLFKKRATEMAIVDEETAASCIYRRPVGKDGPGGAMKYAEGMSIRMAEIVGASYGNLRVYATILEQTERQVIARGMAIDLESNFASSSEVVEATVGRDGKPYSERQRAVVAKAALAKARRDATFQVVPRALAKPIEVEVRKLLVGDGKSLDKRREQVVGWVKTLGIDEGRVWAALGVKGLADVGLKELETLTGLRTAIKDNDTTIDEAFPPVELRAPQAKRRDDGQPQDKPSDSASPAPVANTAGPDAQDQGVAGERSAPAETKPQEEPKVRGTKGKANANAGSPQGTQERPASPEPSPSGAGEVSAGQVGGEQTIVEKVREWIEKAPGEEILARDNFLTANWKEIPEDVRIGLLKLFNERKQSIPD